MPKKHLLPAVLLTALLGSEEVFLLNMADSDGRNRISIEVDDAEAMRAYLG